MTLFWGGILILVLDQILAKFNVLHRYAATLLQSITALEEHSCQPPSSSLQFRQSLVILGPGLYRL